jgi:hypothetical protein
MLSARVVIGKVVGALGFKAVVLISAAAGVVAFCCVVDEALFEVIATVGVVEVVSGAAVGDSPAGVVFCSSVGAVVAPLSGLDFQDSALTILVIMRAGILNRKYLDIDIFACIFGTNEMTVNRVKIEHKLHGNIDLFAISCFFFTISAISALYLLLCSSQ